MKRMNIRRIFFFSFIAFMFLPVFVVVSQDSTKQVQEYQKRLQNTQSEIQKLRKEIDKQKSKEKSSLDQIANIDKENDLIRKYLRQLKNQEGQLRKNIIQTNNQLLNLQGDLEKEREIYSDRLVHFYKHRRLSDLEILLTSKSINQALVYLKYRKRIAKTDQRRLKNLVDTKNKIENANKSKRTKLSRVETLEKEKVKEKETLANRRKDREEILKEARSKKDSFSKQIAEWERAQKELLRLINTSELDRANISIDFSKPTQFPSLKGKMIWPLRGRITRNFGKNKHSETSGFFLYEGIDIKASFGDAVKVTCPGVVTGITWIRGRGNVVMVNHYEGYRTIYTHLSEILVSKGQEVKAGQIIGLVGDSGSISGPILHFQIWQKDKAINPRSWLSRNPS
jgi:murein hydrolase activator